MEMITVPRLQYDLTVLFRAIWNQRHYEACIDELKEYFVMSRQICVKANEEATPSRTLPIRVTLPYLRGRRFCLNIKGEALLWTMVELIGWSQLREGSRTEAGKTAIAMIHVFIHLMKNCIKTSRISVLF